MMELHNLINTTTLPDQSIQDPVFFALDKEGNFIFLSHSARLLFQEDLSEKNIWQEYPKLIRSQFYHQVQTALTTHLPVSYQEWDEHQKVSTQFHIRPGKHSCEVFITSGSREQRAGFDPVLFREAEDILSSEAADVLKKFTQWCATTLGDYCALQLPKSEGDTTTDYTAFADPALAGMAKNSTGMPVLPDILQDNVPQVIDLTSDIMQMMFPAAALQTRLAQAPVSSFLYIPLLMGQNKIGYLSLLRLSGQPYTQQDLAWVEEIGRSIVFYLMRNQLQQSEQNAREQLRKVETTFYNMVMETPALVCLLKGPDHVFEMVNPYFEKFFHGRELAGHALKDVLQERHHKILQLMNNVFQTDKPFIGKEFSNLYFEEFSTTSEKYFNFIIQPTHDTHGHVDGILVFGYEVTDQVMARKVLEEGAHRLRTVLEAIPQMAWTARPDGFLDYYNQRWYDFVGITDIDPNKEIWEMAIHPEDHKKMLTKWRYAIRHKTNFEIESRFIKASDGTYRWQIIRAIPVADRHHHIIFWVGSCTDIHEQKMAFEKLNHVRTQLKHINLELSTKNKELEKTNNDLDNFVYAASHDLKAPVSNIEGLTNLLLECIQEESIHNNKIFTALSMIDFSIKRFKNTIQDLTDIAKINKYIPDDITEIDVNEVIEEVTIMISEMIHKNGARILVRTTACHKVFFSFSNLKSLVYNLLSNALKYRHPDRTPEIIIESRCEADKFILSVQDNGIGIEPRNQEKIFTMFKRLHNHVEGNGVGLFLVKRIVDNAGGKITLSSVPGKGSTFKVFLKNSTMINSNKSYISPNQ